MTRELNAREKTLDGRDEVSNALRGLRPVERKRELAEARKEAEKLREEARGS